MVEYLGAGMEDEDAESHETIEWLMRAYHACVEAKVELDEMRFRGDNPHAEVLELSAIYDGLIERIGRIRVEPVDEDGV